MNEATSNLTRAAVRGSLNSSVTAVPSRTACAARLAVSAALELVLPISRPTELLNRSMLRSRLGLPKG